MGTLANDDLKEAEIRPDHLMKGQAERLAADIRSLLQHKDEFVYVPCPACGSELSNKSFEKCELSYVVCSRCETMYINPRPTPAILDRYYATSENYTYWNKYIFPASEDARREKIFRPRAEHLAQFCRRYTIRPDVFVEVGAGFGTFCEEMRRIGLFDRVIAVEPTPDLAETCRQKRLEVVNKTFEQVQFERETVSAIASFEVIEHLFSPRAFLKRCASWLVPGGLLVLSCPNVKGFDVAVLQALSDTVDNEHLNYFHPASLAQLVDGCEFDVLETLTPGKLDAEVVRKKALRGEIDLSRQPFLRQVLLDEWERLGGAFQQFLAANRLSSHMWLVARKR